FSRWPHLRLGETPHGHQSVAIRPLPRVRNTSWAGSASPTARSHNGRSQPSPSGTPFRPSRTFLIFGADSRMEKRPEHGTGTRPRPWPLVIPVLAIPGAGDGPTRRCAPAEGSQLEDSGCGSLGVTNPTLLGPHPVHAGLARLRGRLARTGG